MEQTFEIQQTNPGSEEQFNGNGASDLLMAEPEKKKKFLATPKSKIAFFSGVVVILLIVAIAIPVYLNATFFQRLSGEVCNKFTYVTPARASDGSYLKLDTNMNDKDEDDMTMSEYSMYVKQAKATLEAVQYINEKLGFSKSVYDDMLNTTSLMGKQQESNRKYTVSWTYHPDRGLEVKYEKN